MHTLAEAETSGPSAVMVLFIAVAVLSLVGLIMIYLLAIRDASYRRWQAERGIYPESQGGEPSSFFAMLIVAVSVAFVVVLLGYAMLQQSGVGLVGDSSEASTVQTADPGR